MRHRARRVPRPLRASAGARPVHPVTMTGGASGGPWIAGFSQAGAGTLTSLNSYKYNGLNSMMFGPKFNSDTQAVWTRADSSSSNQLVP